MPTDWTQTNRQILDALDLLAEYRSMGIETDGTGVPQSTGWVPCKVFKSNERSASAGINVSGEHPQKGRYKEFTGECRNLSFFEFCASAAGRFPDWKTARDHYRNLYKIAAPRGRVKKSPDESFQWQDYNEALVTSWCRHKPPVKHWAFRIAGGRLARWHFGKKPFSVVVLPVFGPHGCDDNPIGYVYWNHSGQALPVFAGKGRPPELRKMKTAFGSESGLMNRYALSKIKDAELVWLVEGPPDCLGVQSMIPRELLEKHVVITTSGGGDRLKDWEIAFFTDKRVFIVPHCDTAGQTTADHRIQALLPVADEIRRVQLPYPIVDSHGKDCRNFFNDGSTYQDLLDLGEAAEAVSKPSASSDNPFADSPLATSPTPTDPCVCQTMTNGRGDLAKVLIDKEICDSIQLEVLGERPDQSVEVFAFAPERAKGTTIRNIDRLTVAGLGQICGPVVREKVHESNEPNPTKTHIRRVREAIGMLAGRCRIGDQDSKGAGIWPGRNGDVILVNAGEAAVWDGKQLTRIIRPMASGVMLDLSSSVPWYDFDTLAALLRETESQSWMAGVVETTREIFGRWCWREGDHAPSLVVGLILATWIQTLWTWRPMVAIRGESNSGKSMLFSCIKGIFGKLGLLCVKPSEAGLRQEVDNQACPVLIDEFESDKHRKAILELLRTSSRGAQKLMGTPGQKAIKYALHHICWVTAVEIGLERQPDRNRFISLESVIPPPPLRGKLVVPADYELSELGQKLLAVAIRISLKALAAHDRLKRITFADYDNRTVESFAVPGAMLALAAGPHVDPTGLLGHLLTVLRPDTSEDESDQERLLRDIFAAVVRIEGGRESAVSQLLARPDDIPTTWEHLERHGIAKILRRRGPRTDEDTESGNVWMFLHKGRIMQHLLRNSTWTNQQIDQILVRLPLAERSRHRVAGANEWGVIVPWDIVDGIIQPEPPGDEF